MRDRMTKTEDEPPMSRLFVLCSKSTTEQQIREHFSEFGKIEDIWVVKNKGTGENKGVAYVKFSKTSEAAAAQEELNGFTFENEDRAIKVLVASSRDSGPGRADDEEERYTRLFIVVPKSMTKDEITDEFKGFGEIEFVNIVKDRDTKESKGFAYVRFKTFMGAANAFENCNPKYKAVFAKPRSSDDRNDDRKGSRSLKRSGGRDDYFDDMYSRDSSRGGFGGGMRDGPGGFGGGGFGGGFGGGNNNGSGPNFGNDMAGFMRLKHDNLSPTTLEVICSSSITQDQLWRLFDIVPGLDYCHITRELLQFTGGPRNSNATVVYTNRDSALYAKEKIHGLEYPQGERLIVRLSASDLSDDPNFINHQKAKDSFCSVQLPPARKILSADTPCAARCFIVLSANIPIMVLRNVFCTFGNLIDIYLLPNKNCGYVKYATEDSAEMAIKTLNGAEIYGARVKVMTAEEPKESKRMKSERSF